MRASDPVAVAVAFEETRRPGEGLRRRAAGAAVVATLLTLAVLQPSAPGVMSLVAVLAAFLWWCWSTAYVVRVSGDELQLRLAPLRSRRVALREVKSCVAHMAYPWGGGPRGPRPVDGVECWWTGPGAGLLVELEDGSALWVDCASPERLAKALRSSRRRRRSSAVS